MDHATDEQRLFYKWFAGEIALGRTPDVGGQIAYLFVLTYEIVDAFLVSREYEEIAVQFEYLRTSYRHETPFEMYLDLWQADAAWMSGNYEDAWRYRRIHRMSVDHVLNIRSQCEEASLTALDLHSLLLGDNGLTAHGVARRPAVDLVADRLLDEHHAAAGTNIVQTVVGRFSNRPLSGSEMEAIAIECGYLVTKSRIEGHYRKSSTETTDEPAYLFGGVPLHRSTVLVQAAKEAAPPPGRSALRSHREVTAAVMARYPQVQQTSVSSTVREIALAMCKNLLRQAENEVRSAEGLPGIGEGWIGETELFRLVERTFPDETVVQHARPDWLKPQHLDIYLPAHNVAIEYQGAQHLRPVEYFGGDQAFASQQERDARKKKLCEQNDCYLMYVFEGYLPDEIVGEVAAALASSDPR